jgi:predicted ATPase
VVLAGVLDLWQGNFIAALKEFDEAYKLPTSGSPKQEVSYGNWRSLCRSLASLALWVLGHPARAETRNREALIVSREIVVFPADLVSTLIWSALLNLYLRDSGTAYARADEATRLAHEHGIEALIPFIDGLCHAWGLAQMGQIEEGLSEMLQWQTVTTQSTGIVIRLGFLTVAEIDLIAGRRREGLEAVGEGLELGQRTGIRFSEAEMHRLKGELLLMGDNDTASEAARCFRDAIGVARRQSAKSWELRATMSLARLLDKQGRRDEARSMLAEIYGLLLDGLR